MIIFHLQSYNLGKFLKIVQSCTGFLGVTGPSVAINSYTYTCMYHPLHLTEIRKFSDVLGVIEVSNYNSKGRARLLTAAGYRNLSSLIKVSVMACPQPVPPL